ncbi:MAG TPA: nucleotide exchange factor GrpE [Streptosporangiaceae bacterium]|jgi:molecular chaperone GrpE
MSEWDLGPVAEAGGGPAPRAAPGAEPDGGADAGTDPETDAAATIADLREQAAAAQDERLRALADVATVRRRCAEQVSRAQAEASARVAAQWLPVVDNLERALEFSAEDPAAIVEGIQAVRDQALGVLAGLDYPRRDDTGAAFDPARHEAVAVRVQAGVPAGTIIDTTQPAYGEGDRQLRPAQVVVAGSD